MLDKLLQIIASAGMHNFTQLAQRLDVSEGLLESMVDELVRMGYLKSLSVKCGADCKGCPIASACAIGSAGRVWVLTEKGQRVKR